jgi:hypothetical protein
MSNFVRRLRKGTDKYKGMLPLKFFNYGGVGHFSNKCPYKKKKGNEEDDSKNKEKIHKGRRKNFFFFKESLCTKKDSSSSDEDEVNESDIEKVQFIEIKDSDEEGSKKECEEEEVNYKEELICGIEALKKENKKKNHSRKN